MQAAAVEIIKLFFNNPSEPRYCGVKAAKIKMKNKKTNTIINRSSKKIFQRLLSSRQ
jgi:hypothetical protein